MYAETSDETPQPVPRRSRSSLLPHDPSQMPCNYVKARSSETNLPSAVDNVEMNAEICRYRKAMKDVKKAASDTRPSSSPGAPALDSIGNDDNIDSLKKRLQDVMEKNHQWQEYDNQRESYVKTLHHKYHELHCRYQELDARCHQITSNPSMLAEKQRQHYDKLLIQARQERESYQNEMSQLKAETNAMKVKVTEELKNLKHEAKHWKELYENELEKQQRTMKQQTSKYSKVPNTNKENWDRVSSLQRQMEMQRKDFSVEQSKRESIERQLENLKKQLKSKENTRKKSLGHEMSQAPVHELRSKSKSMKCTEKPPRPTPPKLTKLSREEKQTLQNDRRSHPIKLSHVTIRKNKTSDIRIRVDEDYDDRLNQTYSEFGSHDDSNLSCPNCGKIYAIDEHEFLLSHIDLCI